MAANKRSKFEIECDRDEVAHLILKGWSVRRIAEHQQCTHQRVHYDAQAIARRWREAQLVNFHEVKQRELAGLNLIEAEAWAGCERSQQPRTSTRVRDRSLPSAKSLSVGPDADQHDRVEHEDATRTE